MTILLGQSTFNLQKAKKNEYALMLIMYLQILNHTRGNYTNLSKHRAFKIHTYVIMAQY